MEDNKTWNALEDGVFPNVEGETRAERPTPAALTLNDYQKKAMTTRMSSCNNFSYMFAGLVAEVGEVADLIAKGVRKEKMFVDENKLGVIEAEGESGEFDDHIKKELGDVLWFVAGLAEYFNLPLEDVARGNLDKLAKRKASNEIVTHKDH